jgi:hypothetical protein
MLWTTLGFTVIGLWAMLTVLGGERRRQVNEQEARERAEAEMSKKPPVG